MFASKMRCLAIVAVIFVLGAISCDAKRWWSRTKKKLEVKPEVGKGGDWKVTGGISIEWRRKRDTQKHGKFNIDLRLDPCELISYDITRDGLVTYDDIKMIFGDSFLAKEFFTEANKNKDKEISDSEFEDFSHRIIQCQEEE